MPLGDPYATLDALKARLGIGPDDTADDARLTAALDAASRGIERACRRQFNDSGAVSVRLVDVDQGRPCTLDIDDVSTDAGLIVETDPHGDGTYAEVWDPGAYDLVPRGGVVDGVPGWPYWQVHALGARRFSTAAAWSTSRRPAPVRVTARWGWAEVPAPIGEACLLVAAETAKLRDAPFGVAGFGEWGMIRVRENPFAAAMVAPYERSRVLVA
jgi:hypothetical protein